MGRLLENTISMLVQVLGYNNDIVGMWENAFALMKDTMKYLVNIIILLLLNYLAIIAITTTK